MKTAVYTAVFGDYDAIKPPLACGDADYIVFSDNPNPPQAPWQLRLCRLPEGTDACKASRYYFTQSTKVLPDYEVTIMHGGNAQLSRTAEEFLPFLANTDIAGFKHPHRNCVYDEVAACALIRKDTWENMQPQMDRYWSEGFEGKPFSACILLVRRNTPQIAKLEELWWEEVLHGSYRDQLSFDYCRWLLDVPITYIEGDCFNSRWMKVNGHNRS